MRKKRVAVAMSGGVDSSVAAAILQKIEIKARPGRKSENDA